MAGMDIDDKEITRIEAIVHSMTKEERRDPDIIDGSRRRRIARGSGTDATDVSGLVKTFNQTRQMMKAMSGLGMMGRMKAMKQLGNMDMFGGKMPGLKIKQRSKRKKGDRKKRSKRR
jgi:signal recognition particle subunit SRP54